MTGNLADAARALGMPTDDYLGEGCTRIAYRINGVVYKVENNDGYYQGANREEWNNYLMFKDRVWDMGVTIPETSLYEVNGKPVIAMEYISGTPIGDCYCATFSETHNFMCAPVELIDYLDGFDTSYGNIIMSDDGRFYLIDLCV